MPLLGSPAACVVPCRPRLARLFQCAFCLGILLAAPVVDAQLAVPAPDALRPSPPGLPNPLTTQNVPFGPKTNQYAPAEDANSFPTLTTQPPNDLQPLPDVTAAPVDATSADADDPALIPLVEQAYPEPGQPMPRSEATLDKVLAIAATDSTTMREQEQLVAANDASRYRSWVQYLPAVDAKYNVGFFDLIRGDIAGGSQTAFGGAYTVEAYKPIYYWGAIEATKKLALLKEQISQTQAIITYAKLCVDLRRQYYELVSQKSRVQLLALEAESASRRVDKERQLLAAGKSYPAHVDSLEITFRSLQLQQASAANTYEFNVGEFRRLSGALDFDQHDIPDYVVLPHVDIAQMRAQYDGFRKSGFFDTAVNKTATLEQDAIDNQIIINDANSKPTFNLGFGVTQGPYQDNSTRTGGIYFQTIIFGGITGTWHLFDNFQTSDNDRSLRAQRRLVDAELAGSRDRIFSQSANLLDKIEISLRGIAMLKQQLTTLQQDYRQVKQSLALGQSDQTDVDTIRDGILRVKFDILQYQTNVVTAYYSFLTTIFCDPALNNVSIYEHPPSS